MYNISLKLSNIFRETLSFHITIVLYLFRLAERRLQTEIQVSSNSIATSPDLGLVAQAM